MGYGDFRGSVLQTGEIALPNFVIVIWAISRMARQAANPPRKLIS
jgi:hypothetical protein